MVLAVWEQSSKAGAACSPCRCRPRGCTGRCGRGRGRLLFVSVLASCRWFPSSTVRSGLFLFLCHIALAGYLSPVWRRVHCYTNTTDGPKFSAWNYQGLKRSVDICHLVEKRLKVDCHQCTDGSEDWLPSTSLCMPCNLGISFHDFHPGAVWTSNICGWISRHEGGFKVPSTEQIMESKLPSRCVCVWLRLTDAVTHTQHASHSAAADCQLPTAK